MSALTISISLPPSPTPLPTSDSDLVSISSATSLQNNSSTNSLPSCAIPCRSKAYDLAHCSQNDTDCLCKNPYVVALGKIEECARERCVGDGEVKEKLFEVRVWYEDVCEGKTEVTVKSEAGKELVWWKLWTVVGLTVGVLLGGHGV